MNIADTEEWDSVVQRSYGLEPDFFESDVLKIKFYKCSGMFFGSYVSTAPYLTDGGVRWEDGQITAEDVDCIHAFRRDRNLQYALVRTRSNLFANWEDRIQLDKSQVSFVMDLRDGADEIWKRKLPAKTRNQVRKGLKNDPTIRIGGVEHCDDLCRRGFYNC